VGLGPYRFVHYQPGVELVLEANTAYWRQVPHVKRLVLKSVPGATTRLAMLKQQKADIAYAFYGALTEEVRRDPRLKLEPVVSPATQWVVFTAQQYDPTSPWYDTRVRLAAQQSFKVWIHHSWIAPGVCEACSSASRRWA
jgi:peptide/nickel transport system substrate-binding protein